MSLTNFHVEYMDVFSHWHPASARYAGGDHLLTSLYQGWEPVRTVRCEQHWYAGMRSVSVYLFELRRGDEKMLMPVIHNPYVSRVIRSQNLSVVLVDVDSGVASSA